MKAVITRWLSHGEACKTCRERYHIIIEALDDITSTTSNPELLTYRNTLLDSEIIYQITFLEDFLSVTNILSLLLQSDRKNFSAIVQSVNMVIEILKNIGENIDTNHLKNFKHANKITEKIEVYERQNIVSSGMCKRQKQDHNLTSIKRLLRLKIMAWRRWPFCITLKEKVKKTAFKGGQFKRMPYMINNFHALYWSLAIVKVMFLNKKSTLTRIFEEGKIFKV